MVANYWNTSLYESKHGYVWQYGQDLLELLLPQSEEKILDLGCGTGHLTAEIAQRGATVIGIDAAASMIEKAQQNYPYLQFAIADARDFQVDFPLDAVFSNAVLHWIPEADAVIECIYRALGSNGRFVAEFGGHGNIQAIIGALSQVLKTRFSCDFHSVSPWYFPSISDYTMRLERHGFEVQLATLFDRPTPLEGEQQGMANWLQMFASRVLERFSLSEQQEIIRAVEDKLRDSLYRDGTWTADYRRIQVVAFKTL